MALFLQSSTAANGAFSFLKRSPIAGKKSRNGLLKFNKCWPKQRSVKQQILIVPESQNFDEAATNSSKISAKSDKRKKSLFRGGSMRPELKLPGLAMCVKASEVLQSREMLEFLNRMVSEVISLVLLEEDAVGGGRLFEAARALKEVIKDRAYLLVFERVDVAAAVGASGIVLSDEGLPAIVARNMMEGARSDALLAPLVARAVKSIASCYNATTIDGADLLLFVAEVTDHTQMSTDEFHNISIPVFVSVNDINNGLFPDPVLKLLKNGASGLIFSALNAINSGFDTVKEFKILLSSVELSSRSCTESLEEVPNALSPSKVIDRPLFGDTRSLRTFDTKVKDILEEERPLLFRTINVLRNAAAQTEEVSLLADAITQLDDLFLLVIVGEFNSGKSTLINAILGKEFLKVGAVPTTNEITFLCYSSEEAKSSGWDKHPDGHFIKYLPAKILQEMTLVDTPGTNVILKRQQKLTEEFVPRADLVLFIMSADRPLSESEVSFLYYIRQWGKKVVFIVNKSDIFKDVNEKEEVIKFVKENARQLLGIDEITIYTVSAFHAMEAKNSCTNIKGDLDIQALSNNSKWISSGFPELEKFIFSFMDTSTSRGAERVRLKLETPINIANAVLAAREEKIIAECAETNLSLIAMKENIDKLNQYQQRMTSETLSWQKQIYSLIDAANKRGENLIDSLLQISNIESAAQYILRRDQTGSLSVRKTFSDDVVGSSFFEMQNLLVEYWRWLMSSNSIQVEWFTEVFGDRWPGIMNSNIINTEIIKSETQIESLSIRALEEFNVQAAAILFEQEIREALIETFGGLGVAGLSASLLTSILPTTIEDLIALVLCSAGGLYGVWKLPQRRSDLKSKVKRASDSLAQQLENAIQEDLEKAMNDVQSKVGCITDPYLETVQSKASHLDNLLQEIKVLERNLQSLQREVQNIQAC